jgi:trk system potassium uptake protein TrkH
MLVSGYFAVTLLFTFLLMLPVSSQQHGRQSFIDAFFMACSGISTTGLAVVDIGSYYSLFGQFVLMLDFQVGGIGYMAFTVVLVLLFGMNLSMKNRSVAAESIAGAGFGQIFYFFKRDLLFTLFIELASGLILFLFWMSKFPMLKALYYGLFHSISAFCTAGFSLFPDSLVSYKDSLLVNLTINLTSLIGGIGFLVMSELFDQGKKLLKKQGHLTVSVHSRLAFVMTTVVILSGTAVIFLSEKWPSEMGIEERFRDSSFQSISASTTDGFNTVDIGAMAPASLLVIIFLMFTGASPGSTGGGIKTTTLGVILLTLWSKIRGKKDSNCFWRRIPDELSTKAFVIFQLYLMILLADWFVLTLTENQGSLQILFEIASALGNTGLSTGITSHLSGLGKMTLALTMFAGRVGPLTLGLALMEDGTAGGFRNAKAEILVG